MRPLKNAARRVIRLAAREFAAALAEQPGAGGSVRVDVEDMVRQLSSRTTNQRLQQYFAWNHRWVAMLAERNRRTAAMTFDFIEQEMPGALFVLNQFRVLETHLDEIDAVPGTILDLGVYKGSSTRALAGLFPRRTIHGFDSFEGLPDDWAHSLKGDFGDVSGALPDVPDNVRLYKGWFDDTLPEWAASHADEPIALLRVDCDIYSSTRTIFESLGHLVRPGTWIVFDELIGYRDWPVHEFKAFVEFIEESGHGVEFRAYGLTYTIVRIIEVRPENEADHRRAIERFRTLIG